MSTRIKFFANPTLLERIRTTANLLRGSVGVSENEEKARIRLAMALETIAANADDFDEHCQFNIGHIGTGFTTALTEYGGKVNAINIPRLNVVVFRFISEYDISVAGELSMELRNFVEGVLIEYRGYNPELIDQIEYAQQRMPIAILKQLLSSDDFGALRNVQRIAQETNDKLAAWKAEIDASEQRVESLNGLLKTQKENFNFVGLSMGFSDLEETIKKELKGLQTQLVVFGLFVMAPMILEFGALTFGWVDIKNADRLILIATAITSVTATLIFLYFFRITLHNADSCRAQLVQVRLRMTLCRFIQNYAEYSTEIKGKNAEALSKFENLIFSGIVSRDDKLPSTFDGIEQLSGLIGNMRSKVK